MVYFIFESAIILSVLGGILLAKYYTKKPTWKEVQKLLDKYSNRHQDENRMKWKYQIYYETADDIPCSAPKSVFWEVRFFRKITPLCILLSSGILFIIDHYFH